REQLREAGAAYQRDRDGRWQHALRQSRYRARRVLAQKVTHQGSATTTTPVTTTEAETLAGTSPAAPLEVVLHVLPMVVDRAHAGRDAPDAVAVADGHTPASPPATHTGAAA